MATNVNVSRLDTIDIVFHVFDQSDDDTNHFYPVHELAKALLQYNKYAEDGGFARLYINVMDETGTDLYESCLLATDQEGDDTSIAVRFNCSPQSPLKLSRKSRRVLDYNLANNIEDYVNKHSGVGDFLYYVLANDLGKAVAKADLENRRKLSDLVCIIHNELPASSYGSYEAVNAWLAREDCNV